MMYKIRCTECFAKDSHRMNYEYWLTTITKTTATKKNNHTSWLHLAQLNKKKATTTNSTTVKYHLNQINLSISVNKQLQRTNIDSVGMLLLIWEKKKKKCSRFYKYMNNCYGEYNDRIKNTNWIFSLNCSFHRSFV